MTTRVGSPPVCESIALIRLISDINYRGQNEKYTTLFGSSETTAIMLISIL